MREEDTDDFAALLDAWRQGHLKRRDLYAALRRPMSQAARRGVRSIIPRESPNEEAVEEALYRAFLEVEKKGASSVKSSLVGLAKRIAYRRGLGEAIRALGFQKRGSRIVAALTAAIAASRRKRAAAAPRRRSLAPAFAAIADLRSIPGDERVISGQRRHANATENAGGAARRSATMGCGRDPSATGAHDPAR